MNILLLLTPKREVAYIFDDFTLRQALEKMEFHRYSAIPILSHEGGYVGTLTEGDILWFLKKNESLNLKRAEETPVARIPRLRDNFPVKITTDIDDLVAKSINQNFIPVLDDQSLFIGIITRKDIILYCHKQMIKHPF
jgi:CBS domain-containing protein